MAESSGTPVDLSPSVASFVGEMYGDFSDAEPESDAGAPPAETPEATSSEGTPADAPAVETPAPDTAPVVPDSSTPTTETDPLEGASPLDYMVDGQPRSFDGVTVLKDGGAIIDPDALVKVRQVFGERDHLYETNQAQYQRYSALEKATEWQQGDQLITGVPALEAQKVYIAQASETIKTLAAILQPETFTKYVAIGQNPDGSYFVAPDTAALEALRERLQFVTDRAAFQARQAFSKIAQPAPAAQPAADAPVETFATGTVDTLAKSLNVLLSDESKAFLAGEFSRYVRATTPEEKPRYGPRIVDAAFAKLVQREASRATETAKIAETASAAARNNQARIAAASVGKNGKQPARINNPPIPEPSRADDFDAAWDRTQAAAAAAMRAH